MIVRSEQYNFRDFGGCDYADGHGQTVGRVFLPAPLVIFDKHHLVRFHRLGIALIACLLSRVELASATSSHGLLAARF